MSRTRVIYLSVLAVIFLFLLGLVIYYLIYGRILADSSYGSEIWRQNKSFDLNSDGKQEAVSIVKYQSDLKNIFILSVANSNKNYSLSLTGFENEVSFCKDNEFVVIGQDQIICLSGYVGVHSENIQLVILSGSNLKPIQFINNEIKENRITSDAPNFGFTDINNDNLNELYIDNRDYEKDPVLDILRSNYYFIDGAFRFNNVESIQYREQTNEDGRIN